MEGRFENSLKKWDRLLAYLLIYFRIGSEGIKGEKMGVMLLKFHLCSFKMFCLMNLEEIF